MPDDSSDLRRHIDAAAEAADRLVREAQERAERSDREFRDRLGEVPERGWDVPDAAKTEPGRSELQVIVSLLGAVREAVPAELSQQMAEAVRELLLAVRALIDWYLERLGRATTSSVGETGPDDRVQDIPIS